MSEEGRDVLLRIPPLQTQLCQYRSEAVRLSQEYSRLCYEFAVKSIDVAERKREAELQLRHACHVVEQLDARDWRELVSYRTPPEIVVHVMRSVMLLLGEKTRTWGEMQPLLHRTGILQSLMQFDPLSISKECHDELLALYANSTKFTYEEAVKGSRALGSVQQWVVANVKMIDVNWREHDLHHAQHVNEESIRLRDQLQQTRKALEVVVKEIHSLWNMYERLESPYSHARGGSRSRASNCHQPRVTGEDHHHSREKGPFETSTRDEVAAIERFTSKCWTRSLTRQQQRILHTSVMCVISRLEHQEDVIELTTEQHTHLYSLVELWFSDTDDSNDNNNSDAVGKSEQHGVIPSSNPLQQGMSGKDFDQTTVAEYNSRASAGAHLGDTNQVRFTHRLTAQGVDGRSRSKIHEVGMREFAKAHVTREKHRKDMQKENMLLSSALQEHKDRTKLLEKELHHLSKESEHVKKELQQQKRDNTALRDQIRELRHSKVLPEEGPRSGTRAKDVSGMELQKLSEDNAALKRQVEEPRGIVKTRDLSEGELRGLCKSDTAPPTQLEEMTHAKELLEEAVRNGNETRDSIATEVPGFKADGELLWNQLEEERQSNAALKKCLRDAVATKETTEEELRWLYGENEALQMQLNELTRSKGLQGEKPRGKAQSKGSADAEMQRLSEENAHLRRQLEEMAVTKTSLEDELRYNLKVKGSADAEFQKLYNNNATLKKQLKQLSKAKVVVEEKLRGNTSLGGVSSSHGSDGCGHSEKPNVSLSGGSLGFAEDLESSFGLSGIKSECGVAKRHSTAARAPRAVSACEEAARVQGALPEGEFDQLAAEGDDVHPMSGSEWERDVDSDGASTTQPMDDSHIQVLRGLRRIERDVRRCCKVVSQIAPCIKEGRQFKRAMQLAERHSECGDGNYAMQRELNEVAGNYKRRVRKAEQTWMRQWEAVRGLQSRLDDVDEELSRLAEFSSPGPTATPEGGLRPSLKESAAAHDFLVGAHKKVSATLRNVRGVLSEMQRQRRDRHESLFAALQRCSPSVAEAYVQKEKSVEWKEAAAFSASAIGMLCVAMGSMMYKRYELN
uniref:Uncharacterized protein TCIL3000_11_13290 n=1 Tax=Trypanosoma congolense (strain IL3000) TaxID=1068625 RepID=G0V2F4_TRYCI|nr:unnamed protein product [Trypanosoma congolense IL3000]